jgi:succinate-acetate transporter protein
LNQSKHFNRFYYTSFCFYGALSVAIGTYYIVSIISSESRSVVRPSAPLLRLVCILIAVISLSFFILTFNFNKTISVLYLTLILSCIFFAAATTNDNAQETTESFYYAGGYLGFIAAILSMWLSFVELLNDAYGGGKELVPLGQWQVNGRFVYQPQSATISQRPSHNNDGPTVTNPKFFRTKSDSSEEILFSVADVENDIVVPLPIELSPNSRKTQHGREDGIHVPTLNISGDQIGDKGNLKDAVSSYVAYSNNQQIPTTTGALLRRLSASPRRRISETSRRTMDYQTKKNSYPGVNIHDTRTQTQHLPLAPNLTATETVPSVSSASSTSSDYTESIAVSLTTKPFRVLQF